MSGNNKKNGETHDSDAPRKRPRAEANVDKASKVLSPASANVQTTSRPTPGKPPSVRPTAAAENMLGLSRSPTKQSSVSNLFGSWAEKARSPKKKGAASSASTTASSATGTTRGRKASTTASGGIRKTATAKTPRRISGISETSESGTSTAGTKAADKKTAPPAKKAGGVMGSIRRGVAGATAKKAATKKAAPASTATGRVLRNRNP